MSKHSTRREFIRQTAAVAAGSALLTTFPGSLPAAPRFAPSDQLNIGLIGCRNRGFDVLREHLAAGGVNCAALCDVDENVLNQRSAELREKYGQKPALYPDFRKLLDDKNVDAVIIGTPDHWHCLPAVYACEAGKDVYVE
ncbi:MAG TPA: Gfo/Idh/MocA family oxidoreductase, partial [Flavilitoribacter sp.]|nr:Gfo/Idh/MocA family oxidoreductase [Flavilitoribacter sp.]